MVQLNVMPQLHLVPEANGKYTLPAACFNLTLEEKRTICTFLRGVKVPTGFLVNVKKLVSMDLSITHYKAHDCHDADSVSTYSNQGYKARVLENGHHPHVLLFSKISQKTIGKQELSDLHEFVVETQNQLEMCLPPVFFI